MLRGGEGGRPAAREHKSPEKAEKAGSFGSAVPGERQELDRGKLCWFQARFWEKRGVGRRRDADEPSGLGNCSPWLAEGALGQGQPFPQQLPHYGPSNQAGPLLQSPMTNRALTTATLSPCGSPSYFWIPRVSLQILGLQLLGCIIWAVEITSASPMGGRCPPPRTVMRIK